VAIKPGSIGKPVPGIEAAVLDDNGESLPPLVTGELALKAGWPSVMTGIWHDPPRYQQYFRFKGWFLTGDTVTRDEEDYYYHQGRNDDLLKLGDRAVGPYEIEQVLAIHPAVREAAAIAIGSSSGKTVVKVFVVLAEGWPDNARLTYDLKAFLSANFPPDFPLAEIVVLEEMPKSRTGKPLRRVLRAMEQGLPSGDVSKLKE
jgi:acetyl-CoA synthetase